MRVRAWHFLEESGRLRYGDRAVVEAGKTYTAEGPLVLCRNGMHASRRAIDALEYTSGPIVCRVELSGEVLDGGDKLCARRRRVLWMADATMVLHEFACREAEMALEHERKAGREPDAQLRKAIVVKRQWMAGKASDSELAAAKDAAWATWAGAAAWAAARDAAGPAAWDAAWAAARDAAGDAAWDAARAAAWDAANKRVTTMLEGLAPR